VSRNTAYIEASRQHLRSANRQLLVLPRNRLRTYGRRAFFVASPSAWNSLKTVNLTVYTWRSVCKPIVMCKRPLRDSSVTRDSFCKLLKSYLFTLYWNIERIRGFTITRMSYTNLLTYLLTNYNDMMSCMRNYFYRCFRTGGLRTFISWSCKRLIYKQMTISR